MCAKKLLVVLSVLLLSSCASKKVELDPEKTADVINKIAARGDLVVQAFKELEARVRVIEGKLKIESPAIPEQKK